MIKKYYKVVARDNRRLYYGRLYSCLVDFKTVNRREYSTKFWTEPAPLAKKKGYLLLCFDDMECAKRFAYLNASWALTEVWECKIKGLKKDLPYKIDIWDNHEIKESFFYDESNDNNKTGECFSVGSVMAEQIKLIRKIGV